MTLSIGQSLLKYILFIFNFIFWLSGIAVISAGATVQIRYKEYIAFLDNAYLNAPILLIIVGVGIALIGFLGCCGAIQENYCMTITFSVLLGLIFLLEIAAGIASYTMREQLSSQLRDHGKEAIELYDGDNNLVVTATWDNVQQNLQCCGLEDYQSWGWNKDLKAENSVPDSCCVKEEPDCGKGKLTGAANGTLFDGGCIDKLTTLMKGNILLVGGVGVGIAFLQLFGVFFACLFAAGIKKNTYNSV